MGELVTEVVDAPLTFVERAQLDLVRTAAVDSAARAELFATLARLNVLSMVARAGSGHLGSSFSSLDLVAWIHLEVLGEDDVYFSSKGHDVPGLYAVLIALGRLPEEMLLRLRRLDGLPGHPDVGTPGIVVNTGSLGMGISKAKGMILGDRLAGRRRRIVVMCGDGELQEGQIWESLPSAVAAGMSELTVVVDHNKLQSDTFVRDVSDLGDLEAKLSAFGWIVRRIDGHDARGFAAAFAPADGPVVVIADTVKGRGVSFMEADHLPAGQLYEYHSGAPSIEDYDRAVAELSRHAEDRLAELGLPPLTVSIRETTPVGAAPTGAQRLIGAYAQAILDAGRDDERIVALDGDLVKDVGLLEFRAAMPDRFIECGIAEQDMVSMAGGLASTGLLPFVHSFASFLSARPNEQIYNNATERRRVVYVGSLAGVLPSGPGHSHQAVRDVASMSAVPGLVIVQPSTEAQVVRAVRWAVDAPGSTYLRLTTAPAALPGVVPDVPLVEGQGQVVRSGDGTVVAIAAGPVVLGALWSAADRVAADGGPSVTVVCHPFLNRVDAAWMASVAGGASAVVTVDDHYVDGALGTLVGTALAESASTARLHRIGLHDVPPSGRGDEVLAACGLDVDALASTLRAVAAR